MRKLFFWLLAFVLTAASAYYQRRTGPTYPVRGEVSLAGAPLTFSLPRSGDTEGGCSISVVSRNTDVTGRLVFKRYKVDEPLSEVAMTRQGECLVGFLPAQPASGRLAYRVVLSDNGRDISLTGDEPVVIRFKGHVPLGVILAHALVMFAAMLLSTRAGLAALDRRADPRAYRNWTVGLLLVGGFLLGSLVQKLAFGTWWTGVPFGWDLTDNKTLIALVVWLIALASGRRGRRAGGWTVAAAIVMLAVFMIPHSVLGSELKQP
jgi:hypothetical protein